MTTNTEQYNATKDRYGKGVADKLNVEVLMDGDLVNILNLKPELQADYLINTDFSFFRSKIMKLWRVENLYYIKNKDGQKTLFKLNLPQLEFVRIMQQDYRRIILLKSRQLGFCLDPNTKILTADLKWVSIKDLPIGQEIVSVDEFPTDGRGKGRKMRTATVQGKVINKRDAFKITFDDGREVVCTSQHPWLSKKNGGSETIWRSLIKRKDLKGQTLKVGDKVRYITTPWGESTLEDYWFGGILDGEGSISKSNASAGINASQRNGDVWDRMLKYAKDNLYNYRIESDSRQPSLDGKSKLGTKQVNKLCFGRIDEMFQLIGKTRPSRFIKNKFWEGRELPGKKSGVGWATIVDIKQLPDQEMIDLQTSTGTYIAEGFVSHNTTLMSIWFLDEVMWNLNVEALQVAHTKADAEKFFNQKIIFAIRNLYPCVKNEIEMGQAKQSRQQFNYPDGSTSGISVSNSARSSTYQMLHISELGKLAKMYQERATEVITGTLPAVPVNGQIIIESTAEGASGIYYDMFMDAWKNKENITPVMTKAVFYPVFYNWTHDAIEIKKASDGGCIPVDKMEECEIDWAEYQRENSLTDEQINYYYLKWVSLQKDIDKLHQEYPTHPMEAFLSSGSPFFNSRKIADLIPRAQEPIKRLSFINGEFTDDPRGDLLIYTLPQKGKRYVIGGDVSEGLMDGDYSVASVIGFDKQIKALYRGSCEPDEYAEMIMALGKWYNTALLAVEFNKDGNWVNTEIRNKNYPNIYVRTTVDDITKEVTKHYGWLTNKKNRDFMLGEMKRWFNNIETVNCRPLLEEMFVFVRDKRGKPQAQAGKHDDVVVATAIALAILQGKEDSKEEETKEKTINDFIWVS